MNKRNQERQGICGTPLIYSGELTLWGGHESEEAMRSAERQAAIRNSLASHRIEGLEPDAKTIEGAEAWTRGELTIREASEHKAWIRGGDGC